MAPGCSAALALLSTDGDRYIVPEGPAKGMKGYFSRGPDGQIDGVHVGGRLATRVVPSARHAGRE